MNWTTVAVALLVSCCLAAGCVERPTPQPEADPEPESVEEVSDGPIPAANEIVMSPGMRITATTPEGTISITAGKGLKRSYTWEGATRSVEMVPRRERWYGSLGLYYPGPGFHWKEHNGIARAVTEEGQQHFKSSQEALDWIRQRDWMKYAYRNDGLVVGWLKVPARKQLDVEVWQIYIEGRKPVGLAGNADGSIVVEQRDQSGKK